MSMCELSRFQNDVRFQPALAGAIEHALRQGDVDMEGFVGLLARHGYSVDRQVLGCPGELVASDVDLERLARAAAAKTAAADTEMCSVTCGTCSTECCNKPKSVFED